MPADPTPPIDRPADAPDESGRPDPSPAELSDEELDAVAGGAKKVFVPPTLIGSPKPVKSSPTTKIFRP